MIDSNNDIIADIIAWISKTSDLAGGENNLQPDTKLLDLQLLDSLQIMDLVFHLEETFKHPIALEELVAENFETPEMIATMVSRAANTGDPPK